MSISMIQAFKKTDLKPTERLVAFMLADHLNDGTGRCDPSIPLLAEETGLDARSIMRAIRRMEQTGNITVNKSGGRRHSYKLHPVPAPVKPLSESHPCHAVTPVTESLPPLSESQGDPCHRVTTPLSESHPNHKESELNHKLNHNTDGTLGLDVEESPKPKRPKKAVPLTWNNRDGWVGLTPEIESALKRINPDADLQQEMAHAHIWLMSSGKPESPRAMMFMGAWLKKAKPANRPTRQPTNFSKYAF